MKAINKKTLATALVAGILSGAVFTANAATTGKTLPTEPYVQDGYTPDTRTAEAKETYANRVTKSDVEGNNHSVFGQDNTVDAIHGSSSVYGNQNVVGADAKDGNIFGDGSSITGYQSQAVGDNNHLVGEQNTGIGMNNVVTGNHTHAIGGGNSITGDQATAVGHYNLVKGHNTVAVGYDNKAQGDKHTVVGQNNIVTGEESIAIGYKAQATGIESTIAVGNNARATANQTTAIGVHTQATGEFSQAIGSYTVASGDKSVAIGDHSTAAGGNSISIGGSKAGAENNIAIGGSAVTDKMGSVAVGNNALALGDYSTALGIQSKALGGVSTAIGDGAKASESWTTALGGVAFATATNAVAVGGKSVASHANSVALGFKSETKEATAVTEATVGKLTYSGFAGNNPQSVVSVGTEGAERQIVNVAAGQINATSTDAINGSQLYAVQDNLNNLGTSVTTVLGGDANLAANGTVTMTNIGGTGESTVHDAIKNNAQRITTNEGKIAANTAYIKAVEAKLPEVQAGENTVVTSTTDDNGKVTYTVSSKDFQPAIDAVDAKAEANKSAIAENAKAITENAEGVKANAKAIEANQAVIAENRSAIAENAKAIETNTAGVKANADAIARVEAKIPTVQAGENTTVDVTVDANGKATYTVNAKDFQPAINAVDAKAEANTKSIEANKAAIAENTEGVKANAAKITEVAKEAKRHSVMKAGKNTTVTKSFGEDGEAVYTVDANIETNHLATKAEVNKHIGAINDRIDGVEGKVAQNAKAIHKLDRDVRKNRKRADAGIAAVAAMANIPQVYLPGKSGVGVGVGHKHGQSALAVGYSRTSDNAHHIIKLSAGVDSQKDVTVGAGYMYQW